MTDLPPDILGTAGRRNRADPAFGNPGAMRPDEILEEEPPPGGPRHAMPSQCLRTLTLPRKDGQVGCVSSWGVCAGVQRDGGCLLDIVRAANAAKVRWMFEVDPHDGYWDYSGPPIPGLVIERRGVGEIHTRWEEGHDPYAPPEAPPSFDCPHCGAVVIQDPENFNWWCPACGKNAKDA